MIVDNRKTTFVSNRSVQTMKYAFSIYIMVHFSLAWSQKGDVVIHKDDRIDALIKQKGAVVPPATSPQMTGYRIQLVFDSNKKTVEDAKSNFIQNNPKVDVYVMYNAPHFVLKVGDFRTKQDAERFREALIRDYPASFVIKETINLPRID
jgi:hypothetical protein